MIGAMEDGIRTYEDEFYEARDLINGGQPELALPILNRLSAFLPQDRGPFEFWKAAAYERMNQLERAEACARAAIAIEPSYGAATVLLSFILEKQGRAAEALELCQRAVAEYPDSEDLAQRAIAVAHEMELHDLVVDSAQDYLRHFGKNAAVLANLGGAYVGLTEYRKADRAFRDAAALEPDIADHHANVLILAISIGDDAAADAYLAKLARRNPELADIVADTVDQFFEELEENPL